MDEGGRVGRRDSETVEETVSTSTNAILFYGYHWDGDPPWSDPGEDEDDGDYEDRYEDGEDDSDDDEPPDAFGCGFGTHCSYECPMYYLAVRSSEQEAYRGNPVKVKTETGKEWDARLAKALKKYGIEPPQKNPQWWLVSLWVV